MGWLNPLALWFLAGGSIPVIIHLLHRQKYKKIRWAAMEWLLAAIRKTRRRLQLENLILLLIRILIMLLLAFALARPFLSGAATNLMGESDTHYIFVIDNSYSMEYKPENGQSSSFDRAKQASLDFIKTLQRSEKDRYTVMTLSEYPEIVKSEWNNLDQVKQAIEDLRVSQYGTNTLTAFQVLQQMLDRNRADAPKNADRRVYLFTDMQRNGWELDEANTKKLQELSKSLSNMDGTSFYIVDYIGTVDAPNLAILDLGVTNKVLTIQRPLEIVVLVQNFSSKNALRKVQLLVDGALVDTQPVAIEAGKQGTVTFRHSWRGDVDAGPHHLEARFDPQDKTYDYPSVDNHRHLAIDVKPAIRALLIDGEPKDGKRLNRETGTLEIALATAGIFKCQWVTPHNFYEQKLEEYDLVALCNVKSLQPDILRKLEEFVERGGGLFVTLGSQVDAVWYNREMAACNGRLLATGSCQKCARGLACDGEVDAENKCKKCFRRHQRIPVGGSFLSVAEGQVTLEKRTNEDNKVEEVPVHSGGMGLLPARLGEVVGTPPDLSQSGVPRRPSKVNTDHRVFSLFKDVARAQPYSLVFWKFFKTEGYDPRGVLAEFDDSIHSPLMIEQTWHEGRVILFTTAIDAEKDWNAGIPGRAPYIPIIHGVGEYLAARTATLRNFFVGEPLQFFVPHDTKKKFRLYLPSEVYRCPKDGADRTGAGACAKCQSVLGREHLVSWIEVIPEPKNEEDRFMEILYSPDLSLTPINGSTRKGLQSRGIYTLTKADAKPDDKPVSFFGANVGPRQPLPEQIRACEGNLETMPKDEFKKRYPEFKVEFIGDRSSSGDGVKFHPPETELWRKVLFALLGFLVIESILACIFGRSKQ